MNEEENKSKIIPSYMKNGSNKVEDNSTVSKKAPKIKKDKKEKKVSSKITIIAVLLFMVIVILSILGIYKLIEFFRFKQYSSYSNKMERYSFASLYNNGEVNSSEYVTKSEAMKVIIAATLNKNDISEYMNYTDLVNEEETDESGENTVITENKGNSEKYKNSMWVEYATSMGIITEKDITEANASKNATYMDVINYLSKAKEVLLRINKVSTEAPTFKDIDTYSVEEQSNISDLISTGILENSTKKLNGNKVIHKGELNKIIVNLVEKNTLITINGEKLNINKEKEPSNASNYPYILANVDKAVYEKEDTKVDKNKYKNALKCFADMKEQYLQIYEIVNTYFNTILNIDYSTLSDEKIAAMKDDLNMLSSYYADIESLDTYIEYVKSNNIKISGSAKVQMPCVYFDGENYRARVKLSYTIENANDMKNLIFGDMSLSNAVSYASGKTEKVIDAILTKSATSNIMYVVLKPISEL